MKCPHCETDIRAPAMETRQFEGATYRRRSCGNCNSVFVTKEEAPLGLKMPVPVRDSRTRGQLDVEKRNEDRRVSIKETKADFTELRKVW